MTARLTKRPKKQEQFGLRKWAMIFLILLNVLTYSPVRDYGFVNYDDTQYITRNPQVTKGLTWGGVRWAFTTGDQANWHPVTWLSHMLDVQLFGMDAGLHHLTNLLLHTANSVLLFGVLFDMTAAIGESTFVAALFAVHPLHVESVAWVAERKDVLSTLFWMLTMLAYVRYVRRPGPARYAIVVGLFAVGLMTKPMLVTLPFVLLLLDYWPLRRWTLQPRGLKPTTADLKKVVLEKVPLFILTVASSVVTTIAQQRGGALAGADVLPITNRISNACLTYVAYIGKIFWPTGLTALYPMPHTVSAWWIATAIVLIAMSILAIQQAKARPYVFVGWFWFVGTLVPVIGLVQVGRQAMADRYTYVPSIGVFLIVAFGVSSLVASSLPRKRMVVAAAGVLLFAGTLAARGQLGYWSSSEVLWKHAIEVTNDNALAHYSLAIAVGEQRNRNEAIREYLEALRIEPVFAEAHYNIALAFTESGRTDEAIAHYTEAIRLAQVEATGLDSQQLATGHFNLALALAGKGKVDEAGGHFVEAIHLNPGLAEAHTALASTVC
jgi:hypothetical protein